MLSLHKGDIPVFRKSLNEPASNIVNGWFRGINDAIQKKFLKEVILTCFKDKNKPEDILESYHFCLKYSSNGGSSQLSQNSNNSVGSIEFLETLEDQDKERELFKKMINFLEKIDMVFSGF